MIPATLGQFTGQLATPLSFLGNIALATTGTEPEEVPLICVSAPTRPDAACTIRARPPECQNES